MARAFLSLLALAPALALASPRHFAPNGNFDSHGGFAPQAAGFDIADIATAAALDGLPDGVKGLLWVGRCAGPDARFRALVEAAIDHPKFFGFYLADDPDPRGRWGMACSAESLRAEADFVHARKVGAVTFIALMNVGSSAEPAYDPALGPANSHVDLFGVAPYPCRRDGRDCDTAMIGRFVAAAARIGVGAAQIVPIYQTFGGGAWRSDSGGGYRLPEPGEMRRMLEAWRAVAPAPAFDFAYSWGAQRSDDALEGSPALQGVFRAHNSQ